MIYISRIYMTNKILIDFSQLKFSLCLYATLLPRFCYLSFLLSVVALLTGYAKLSRGYYYVQATQVSLRPRQCC